MIFNDKKILTVNMKREETSKFKIIENLLSLDYRTFNVATVQYFVQRYCMYSLLKLHDLFFTSVVFPIVKPIIEVVRE